LRTFKENLEAGMRYYAPLLAGTAFPGENVPTLAAEIELQTVRLMEMWLSVAPEGEREAGALALASA
jgi:hypothetical protein